MPEILFVHGTHSCPSYAFCWSRELCGADEAAFGTLGRRLIDAVDEHIRDEEVTAFPRLVESAGPEDLRRLGEHVASALDPACTRADVSAHARPRLTRILVSGPRRVSDVTGAAVPGARPRTSAHPVGDRRGMWPDLVGGTPPLTDVGVERATIDDSVLPSPAA
jgi:hypothetical protein